ncbi:hypothetical protein M1555_03440 [Patescibacteria group bacterium]|nr:hypothetical protein [Patescibacteria group bacterium]
MKGRESFIEHKLEDLGCPPGLRTEIQVFGLFRESLTNQNPEEARRNLKNLRSDWPAEDGIPFAVPKVLTPEFENALRSGELGDLLKATYIAGLIQAGEQISEDEIGFVKTYCLRIDLGSFTWGH